MDPVTSTARICVVDDNDAMAEMIGLLLRHEGYEVVTFRCADDFLEAAPAMLPTLDLIISDVSMPGLSGFDLCREVRTREPSGRIPIVLVTGHPDEDGRMNSLESGADEFLYKPFRREELLAKTRSLIGIRAEQKEVVQRLRQFVPPPVAELALRDEAEPAFRTHRSDVTVLFIDLRRFTAFAERTEPEEVLKVLESYYGAIAEAAREFRATIGQLAGDGVMLFVNDPVPVENHPERALDLALAIRARLTRLRDEWRRRDFDLDFGIGVASGFATIGAIGCGDFRQYSVIGTVTNLAARLCQAATDGQVLIPGPYRAQVGAGFPAKSMGKALLKGLQRQIEVFEISKEPARVAP